MDKELIQNIGGIILLVIFLVKFIHEARKPYEEMSSFFKKKDKD